MAGVLYLVPTPIGEPRDLTLRALDVLGAVDLIAAEDTRHAQTLLRTHGLDKRTVSYFDHNEPTRAPWLVTKLVAGESVALISDAGTPLINDPGFRLVRLAREAGVRVVVLPGACAAVTALVAAGLPTDRFLFAGFLPRVAGARERQLQELAALPATLVFYEAPHRLVETLQALAAALGDRAAAVALELTKPREELLRGPLSELAATLGARERVAGEATVVVAGCGERAPDLRRAERHAAALLEAGVAPRRARDLVADAFDLPRRAAYDLVLRLAGRSSDED
jgi:16S rRNA (cytidine1402-2'-O)-methyltransferase